RPGAVVHRDRPELVGQIRELEVEHRPVHHRAVHEHDRGPGSSFLVMVGHGSLRSSGEAPEGASGFVSAAPGAGPRVGEPADSASGRSASAVAGSGAGWPRLRRRARNWGSQALMTPSGRTSSTRMRPTPRESSAMPLIDGMWIGPTCPFSTFLTTSCHAVSSVAPTTAPVTLKAPPSTTMITIGIVWVR